MAKYRITSIPQFRDGGGKRRKKKTAAQSNLKIEVENIVPSSPLTSFMPGQSMVNQPTTYTIDPAFQTEPTTEDKVNRLFAKIYNPELESEDGFYEPLLPENCPQGYKAYKGECVPRNIFLKLVDKESDYYYDTLIEKQKQIEKNQKDTEAKELADFNERYIKYNTDALKKGNKHKKLKPFYEFNKEEYDKLKNIDFDTSAWYIETDSEGGAKIYPKKTIEDLIYNWGVRPNEFKKYHGLDDKKIETEFKDYISYSDAIYKNNVTAELNKKISSGMSAEEARKEIEKEGWATKKGADLEFTETSDQLDAYYNADQYYTDDEGVMYKQDKEGNVFQYTPRNQWTNDNFSVFNDNSVYQSPYLAQFNNNDSPYKDKFTWNFDWKPIDKSAVENKNLNYFGHSFNNRKDNPLTENKVIQGYEEGINKAFDTDNNNSVQNIYTHLNNSLYDHVYGTSWKDPLEKIDGVSNLLLGLDLDYIKEYNKTVDKLNAVTDNDKYKFEKGAYNNYSSVYSSEHFKDLKYLNDTYQKQKAKIFDDFNTKVSGSKYKIGDQTIYPGQLSSVGMLDNYILNRDPKAYKSDESFFDQQTQQINREANSLLQQIYLKEIRPTDENAKSKSYFGESPDTKTVDDTYQTFYNTPFAKNFLESYKANPFGAKTLFKNTYINTQKNIYDKELKEATEKQKQEQDKLFTEWNPFATAILGPVLGNRGILNQFTGFLNQPINTLDKWFSGNLQDPYVGQMTDEATSDEAARWRQMYGPGGDDLFYNKIQEIHDPNAWGGWRSPLTDLSNLLWTPHWTGQFVNTGAEKLRGNKDIDYSTIALNALFGVPGVSELGAIKVLPEIGALGKTGKFARNILTPQNAILGKFAYDAWNPNSGFAIEAGKNLINDFSKGDIKKGIQGNALNLGMGLLIGSHLKNNLINAIPKEISIDNYNSPDIPTSIIEKPVNLFEDYQFQENPELFEYKTGDNEWTTDPGEDRPLGIRRRPFGNNFGKRIYNFGGELPKARYGRFRKGKGKGKGREREFGYQPELPFPEYTNPIIPQEPIKPPEEIFKDFTKPNDINPEFPIDTTPENQLSFDFSKTSNDVPSDLSKFIEDKPVEEPIASLPGLNLSLLADPNSNFYKAIDPKTGEINFEQAVNMLRKTAGGDEVLDSLFSNPFLWQGMEYNPKTKISAKEFLNDVQQSIPRLLRREVPYIEHIDINEVDPIVKQLYQYSGNNKFANPIYGLENIYPKAFQDYVLGKDYNAESGEAAMKNKIKKDYLAELSEQKTKILDEIEGQKQLLDRAKDPWEIEMRTNGLTALDIKLQDIVEKENNIPEFENFQIINPRTIQFNNLNELGYGALEHGNPGDTLAHAHVYENYYDPDALYVQQIQSDAAQKFSLLKKLKNKDANSETVLPDPYLEEFKRHSITGDLIPHFAENTESLSDPEIVIRNLPQKRVLLTNKKSTEKRLIQEMLLYAAQQGKKHIYIPTPELSEKIQGNASAADYYKDYKKHYTKLFGESNVESHTDQFGNKWLKLNVPKSYSEGKGVIEAYKDGGYISAKLTKKEIDQYIKGGYIIEDE